MAEMIDGGNVNSLIISSERYVFHYSVKKATGCIASFFNHSPNQLDTACMYYNFLFYSNRVQPR